MSWRVIAASAPGTSHLAHGLPCEDRCVARVDASAAGGGVLSVWVADGAGSAEHGADGAELAVQSAAEVLAREIGRRDFSPDDLLAVECLTAIRARIEAAAEARERAPRDFACTFVGAVSHHSGTLVMQVGDGGVVLDVGEGLELAIAPMNGEYANQTRFIIDDDAAERLVTRLYDRPVRRLAAFTDGIQRLALDLTTLAPHAPLFDRLFDVMEGPAAQDALQAALERFLVSADVNSRTDDDKTLALAVLSG